MNDQRASEVPVRYLQEMQPPVGSIMEKCDWGRFVGAETVTG